MARVVPVIIAGGFGLRLWPLSRVNLPKQFARFAQNDLTLFQKTVARLRKVFPFEKIIITINKIHYMVAMQQLSDIKEFNFFLLLESESRNTFAAILSSCAFCSKNDTLFVAPSDHLIDDEEFIKDAKIAIEFSTANKSIVMFGIKPTEPSTGYGYIESDKKISKDEIYLMNKFHEKPDSETAKQYLLNNNYYWNSGIFIMNIAVFLDNVEKLESKSYGAFLKLESSVKSIGNKEHYFLLPENIMSSISANSIDYLILEKTDKAYVMRANFDWSDLGNWSSLANVLGNEKSRNTVLHECNNCAAINNTNLDIALVGLNDVVIVVENDAVLVASKSNVNNVKDIATKLCNKNKNSAINANREYRPWGYFDIIKQYPNVKIKELTVLPGKALSMQSHSHRAEHWAVSSGIATVYCDGNECILNPGQSIAISGGAVHQLKNDGDIELKIIETQSGDYLGEDDIMRY